MSKQSQDTSGYSHPDKFVVGTVYRKGGEAKWGSGMTEALPVEFDNDDPIKLDGDRWMLIYGTFADDDAAILGSINRHGDKVQAVLQDIQDQANEVTDTDTQIDINNAMARYSEMTKYGDPFLAVLYFTLQNRSGTDQKQGRATHGNKLENQQNGKNGLLVLSQAGIPVDREQINRYCVVFPPNFDHPDVKSNSTAMAVAVSDPAMLSQLVNNLQEQLDAIESLNGTSQPLGKITGDAKRTANMLKKLQAGL